MAIWAHGQLQDAVTKLYCHVVDQIKMKADFEDGNNFDSIHLYCIEGSRFLKIWSRKTETIYMSTVRKCVIL